MKDYSTILFTPEEIGNHGAAYLQQRMENKGLGVPFYLRDLDSKDIDGNILLPAYPGDLTLLIARPGNAKTGVMMRWARERSNWLRDNGKGETHAVVYVSLEQTIEELNAFNVAANERLSITNMAMGEITEEEWKRCLKAGINRRFDPLWNIGYSAMTDKKQIRIDIDAIGGALNLIREQHGKTIDLVCVDYLQRIPYEHAESKTVGVSDNLDGLKTIAMKTAKAPVVCGVQARREVDDSTEPIPNLDDGQWTSNIEQTGDRIMSLVRPTNYKKQGEMFGSMRVDGRCQLLITVLKQKLGPANWAKWCYFDPVYNQLDRLEHDKQNLPGAAK